MAATTGGNREPWIRRLVVMLDTYRELLNSYVVNFFVDNHWEGLPRSWREAFEASSFEDICLLLLPIEGKEGYTADMAARVWPLTLLSFVKATRALSPDRQPSRNSSAKNGLIKVNQGECLRGKGAPSSRLVSDHLLLRHIKPKKQHELIHISQVISDVAQRSNCCCILDVGAGQGHLSRFLSHVHGLDVVSIEAEGGHLQSAQRFDKQVALSVGKKKKYRDTNSEGDILNSVPGKQCYITTMLSPQATAEEVALLLESQFAQLESGMKVGKKIKSKDLLLNLPVDADMQSKLQMCEQNSSSTAVEKQAIDIAPIASSDLSEDSFESHKLSSEVHEDKIRGVNLPQPCHSNVKIDVVSKTLNNIAVPLLSKSESETEVMSNVHASSSSEIRKVPSFHIIPENISTGPIVSSVCHDFTLSSDQHLHKHISTDNSKLPGKKSKRRDFILVGLHTCGDLAPSMMRIYAQSHNARGLVSVGCCYMKATTCADQSAVQNVPLGYPMSQFASTLPGHKLSYRAREVACHAIENYAFRIRNDPAHLKVHCYRAAMEVVLRKYGMKQAHVKLTRNESKLSFDGYARAVLKSVAIEDSSFDVKELSPLIWQWEKVAVFFMIRVLLAPCVEGLILLDRLQFLKEQGCDAELFPLFDPALSPRNIVIVSNKTIS